MSLPLAALVLAFKRTNATMVTSHLGWEHRARAPPPPEDAWTLSCEGPLTRRTRMHARASSERVRNDGSAPITVTGDATVVTTSPVGARCRLRMKTVWRGDAHEPALADACWVGFGQRLCVPRGIVEHFEFEVHVR